MEIENCTEGFNTSCHGYFWKNRGPASSNWTGESLQKAATGPSKVMDEAQPGGVC